MPIQIYRNFHLKFLSRSKKNYVYPCEPLFYHMKVRFKRVGGGRWVGEGSKLYRRVVVMDIGKLGHRFFVSASVVLNVAIFFYHCLFLILHSYVTEI